MNKQEMIDEYDEEFVEDVFDYLVELRDSGETNMLAAGSSIEEEFGLKRRKGAPLLSAWIDTFKE